MKTHKKKWLLMAVSAGLLTVLSSGCASTPQISPDWEWHQMSNRYPYPPPTDLQPQVGYLDTPAATYQPIP